MWSIIVIGIIPIAILVTGIVIWLKRRKIMKKWAKLLIGLCMLVVLILLLLLVKNINSKEEKEQSEDSIVFLNIESTDITNISYASADNQKLTFTINDGTWMYDEDNSFPLNQELITAMSQLLWIKCK